MSKAKKPTKELLSQIVSLEKQIEKLYKKKSDLKKALVEKYGSQDFVYELDKPTQEGHRYLRLRVVDNLTAFESGISMFRSVGVGRFDYELNYLKHEPKVKE